MPLKLPPDLTPEEIKIIAYAKTLIYKKLKDPKDKFIVAYVFDMGYSRADAALALDCSYKTVWEHIKNIKKVLAQHYKVNMTEGNETPEKLLEQQYE